MAKKNSKTTGSRDVTSMSKSELKAYHKEISEFYTENGWRETLSHYKLSPGQAGGITEKAREKKNKDEAAAKVKRKKEKVKAKREREKGKKGKKGKAKRTVAKETSASPRAEGVPTSKGMKIRNPKAQKAKAPNHTPNMECDKIFSADSFGTHEFAVAVFLYMSMFRQMQPECTFDDVLSDLARRIRLVLTSRSA